jgi:DNA (cytosine-5)-methyltransferase 1
MKSKESKKKFKAVDFFCSGGGMTSGFRKAGVNVIGGIDFDPECEATYTFNNPGSKFILSDIKKLKFSTLEKELKIKKNDNQMIFIGCSPCQYWSNIKTIKAKSEVSKNLLIDFQKFVEHFKPGYIVIENVPGILNRVEESPLKNFLKFLDKENYKYVQDVINASHYGVPQTRRRFLLIASRVTEKLSLPIADTKTKLPTVRDFIGNKSQFKPIPAGHKDTTKFLHSTAGISDNNLKRLMITPHDGGTRIAWKDSDLQIPAYINKDNSFQDIYGRMFWDKPGPTITTKFYSITNGRFAHPEQNRAISLREGATLQTFDKNYQFISDSIASTARLIGNAVPPQLSKRIAASIINSNQK